MPEHPHLDAMETDAAEAEGRAEEKQSVGAESTIDLAQGSVYFGPLKAHSFTTSESKGVMH